MQRGMKNFCYIYGGEPCTCKYFAKEFAKYSSCKKMKNRNAENNGSEKEREPDLESAIIIITKSVELWNGAGLQFNGFMPYPHTRENCN